MLDFINIYKSHNLVEGPSDAVDRSERKKKRAEQMKVEFASFVALFNR